MEVENRLRELEQKRRRSLRWKKRRRRQLRRRMMAAGLVLGAMCLAAGAWTVEEKITQKSLGGPSKPTGNDNALVTMVSQLASEQTEADTRKLESVKLPSRFDLRELGSAPTVPDQGKLGTCWAFAALGALESSMSDEMRAELSADHMSLKNSFGLGQDAGGDYSMSSAYLLAWQGPVAEADDPYGDGYSPDGLEPICHVQEIWILDGHDLDAVKRAIYENGGVQSAVYLPQLGYPEMEQYYNEEACAFYYDGAQEPNHDLVIIGWDDQYPKENFVKEPAQDGAFLCMNTWGDSFGDRGYFYISYEDRWIGQTSISYVGIEDVGNYDAIYQTDLCGWTGQLGYGEAFEDGTEEETAAWSANVYEAEMDGILAAAGFYAVAPDTSYRVYAALLDGEEEVLTADSQLLESGRRVLAAEGHVTYSGFYTVRFEVPFVLERGQRFVIMAELTSAETAKPVAVEYASGERTRNVDIEDGEGYISPDGIHWKRTETELQCNVCLKAYIRNVGECDGT